MSELSFICVVDCPDCDTTIVTDEDLVSVFIIFDEIVAIAICGYCERPVSSTITKDFAEELAGLNVKIFSWESGKEVGISGVKNI